MVNKHKTEKGRLFEFVLVFCFCFFFVFFFFLFFHIGSYIKRLYVMVKRYNVTHNSMYVFFCFFLWGGEGVAPTIT